MTYDCAKVIHRDVAIGFCLKDSRSAGMPGWDVGSWAYHGCDGRWYDERGSGREYGQTYGPGDTIGSGYISSQKTVFFTRNGVLIGKRLG